MPLVLPTVDRVETLVGRELDAADRNLVAELIADAAILIRARIPNIDQRIDDGTIDGDYATLVVANAVVRVLKNPDGYRSETMGSMGFTIDTRAAAGFLTILADEWEGLGVPANAGAAFIAPATDQYAADRMGVNPAALFQYSWPVRPSCIEMAPRWFG